MSADSSARTALLKFWLLPTRSLAPSRAQQLWPQDASAPAVLLQHPAMQRSLERRRTTQLHAFSGSDTQENLLLLHHSAHPLIVAPAALFSGVQRHAGLLLLGGHIRRTIARQRVLLMESQLGTAALQWARDQAAALYPGLDEVALRPLLLERHFAEVADRLGAGLMTLAWSDASAALRQRADARLSEDTASYARIKASCALSPRQACALCLRLLSMLESA